MVEMTNKFKDALDETMQGGLHIHLKYEQESGQSLMRPVEPQHINTIRQALTICKRLMEEPSEDMIDAGWRSGVRATTVISFRAMVEQLMKEVDES